MNTNTTVIYIDMDYVLCDYDLGYKAHKAKYPDLPFPQSQPGLYTNLLRKSRQKNIIFELIYW